MKIVETSAKTVELAIEKALEQLGCTLEQAEIKVLSEGSFLKQAKVEAFKKATEAEKATEFVEELLAKMGLVFAVETKDTEEEVNLELIGTDTTTVIGYRGEVLDAIQYLTSIVANNGKKEYKRINIDAEGYREKRVEVLKQLAKNLESKAIRTAREVVLEPMNSFERRIIHSALQESEFVTTASEGFSPNRFVVIKLKGKQTEADQERKSLHKFAFSSEKKKRR